jgi:hypothetical protein
VSSARSPLKRHVPLVLIVGALLAVAGCGGAPPPSASAPAPGARCAGGGRAATTGGAAVPRFSHIVVMVFENHGYEDIAQSDAAPTFHSLARQNASLDDYCAVAHPSLPNYLAMVSGGTHGITDDCTDCSVNARNLADTLQDAGRTWKTYAEGLPRPGFTGASAGRYAKKHDPFTYFDDVRRDPARLARIVPYDQLGRDLAARDLPDFSLVVPDLCHDMHDCSYAAGDAWLKGSVDRLLASPQMQRGVVFVVFDESEGSDHAGGGGHITALALGPTVRHGARSSAPLSHYSLLRTIEDAWRLPRLGHSASARPIAGIWKH